MLGNYLRTALRNLLRNKGFSAINIIGLALGLACSLVILLWVRDERSVDAFHQNGNRLFTVYERQYDDGKVSGDYATPGLLPAELVKDFPEVEAATGFGESSTNTFAAGDKVIKEQGAAAGPDFFQMFSYPLLEGRTGDVLNSPESIAISRAMAAAFFGSPSEAMGKTIRYDNRRNFTIKAVFENVPTASSEKFDFLLNWDVLMKDNDWMKDWRNDGSGTQILLRPGADPAQLAHKLTHFLDPYKGNTPGFHIELGLQKYGDRYLHARFDNGIPGGGRVEYVVLFSIVSVFILLIACINFMNLTTARSTKRAREVGVRKVMGAMRGSLIRQFIGEALLTATLSEILALALVFLALPLFNGLTGKDIVLPTTNPAFWMALLSLTLVTGFCSGTYPAFFLSAFQPIRVLKGGLVQPKTGVVLFRKGLVVFQFSLSIVLIISTVLISRQIRFIREANLGYDRGNLVFIPIEGDLAYKQDLFKQQALGSPGVLSVSQLSSSPTDIESGTTSVDWTGKNPNASVQFVQAAVGYDFVHTMRLHMVQGRDFSKDFPSDASGYLLNETALRAIGYTNPIGKPLTFWGQKGPILGIIRDFHIASLHNTIDPLVVRMGHRADFGTFLVRLDAGRTQQALASLGQICKTLNPKFPFSYTFSDDEYARLYKSEQVVGSLSVIFAILAIAISCLGLLGLSMFMAEQKTKEVSIRKVLGASVHSLFALLSAEFLWLVGIAFLIAAPVAWWAMHQWLDQFAYKTSLHWWMFGVSGVIALLISLATVSFQTIKAATANPAKSLRTE